MQLLARSWFWRVLFSIQIRISKSIEKLICSAFGKIFWVLMTAFFDSNSNFENIEKLFFLACGKILVLVNAFFDSNSNLKKY